MDDRQFESAEEKAESLLEELVDITRGNFVQLTRIYDMLQIIAQSASPEHYTALRELHDGGETLSPAPQLNEGAFD